MHQLAACLPQMATPRPAPCRMCNVRQLHAQRVMVSLQSFASQRHAAPARRHVRSQAGLHGEDWSTEPDSYLTLVSQYCSQLGPNKACYRSVQKDLNRERLQGLAHCFEKDDYGKLKDKFVIEPISANALECMSAGMPGFTMAPCLLVSCLSMFALIVHFRLRSFCHLQEPKPVSSM